MQEDPFPAEENSQCYIISWLWSSFRTPFCGPGVYDQSWPGIYSLWLMQRGYVWLPAAWRPLLLRLQKRISPDIPWCGLNGSRLGHPSSTLHFMNMFPAKPRANLVIFFAINISFNKLYSNLNIDKVMQQVLVNDEGAEIKKLDAII